MGIINLRSGIYTVMDLGLLLGMPPYSERIAGLKNADRSVTRFSVINPAIVILNIEDRIFGIIVDSITAMINLDGLEIAHPPLMLEGVIQSLANELFQFDNRLIMKLDLEKLIEHEALKALEAGLI
jgi:chemotaxis signal transduction protein